MDFLTQTQPTNRLTSTFVAVSFAGLYLLYGLSRAVYNVYFHPLSKFPGPPSRAGFWLIDLLELCVGTKTWEEKALHEKYGPVVRTDPESLSFTTSQAWKDIAGTRQGKKQLQKDPAFYQNPEAGKDIITADDKDHARMRKLLAHAFSDSALREQESLMTQYFELLVEQLQKQIDGPAKGKVNVVSWYNFTTFDIIGDLSFGEPFGSLANGEYHTWVSTMFEGIKFSRFIRVAYRYKLFSIILTAFYTLFAAVGEGRKKNLRFSRDKALERLSTKTDRKDFMTYASASPRFPSPITRYNDERGMTKEELAGNTSILVVAGSETTATLLSGATYFLMKNPRVWNKLKDEIRSSFQSAEDINIVSTGKLPYLHAVLEESLRRYPPVPSRLPRKTGAEVEVIDGHVVPPRTSVGVPQYAANHSTANFHNPEVFAPERWLPDPPAEYANDDKASMQPFSLGPRNCLGKNLAYVEMRSILARIVWNFEMELCPESATWAETGHQKSYILWEKPPLWVKLSRREKA